MKARVNLLMLAPIVLFVALAGLFLGSMFRDNPDELPSARLGQEVPALSTVALGARVPLTAEVLAAPGVKLVNFWASWCVPCRVEHPNILKLSEEGIPVYGINYKDDPADAEAFLDELGDPYAAIGADPKGRTGLDWGLYGVPETFVIDGAGQIVLRLPGPVTEAVMEGRLRPAIEAARAAAN